MVGQCLNSTELNNYAPWAVQYSPLTTFPVLTHRILVTFPNACMMSKVKSESYGTSAKV